MDELTALVSRQAGLSESQAAAAVEAVTDYMRDHFPEPIGWQVSALLDSKQACLDCIGSGGKAAHDR